MDFWTVILQIVNFLIFAGLLHHLLYKPVKGMMENRRQEMESSLEEAKTKREEARKMREAAEAREKELEEQRQSILDDAREKGENERRELLEQAENEAHKRMERYRRALRQEERETLAALMEKLGAVVVGVAGRVVQDSGADLQGQALDRFAQQLKQADPDEIEQARTALQKDGEAVQVRTASDLTDGQTKRLRETITDVLGVDTVQVETETDAGLLAGLEVTLGPLQVQAHWSAAVQEALQHETDRLLEDLRTDPDESSARAAADEEAADADAS